MNVSLAPIGLPLAQAATQNVEQNTQQPASAPAEQALKKDPPPAWTQWGMYILLFVALYFVLLRPKSKQEKQRVNMLNTLKKGDRIQTIGGILGTVVEVRDDEIVVKVDETNNTKLTFSRNAIHRIREEEKKS